MYKHVNPSCKHIPPSEQPLQFQSGYYLNKNRSSHIIVLDMFRCHCRRHSHCSGFTFQLCPVIHSSLNKADDCRSRAMAGKKIKLEEDAVSEIMVADTDSESDAEASDAEDYSEEEEEEEEERKKGKMKKEKKYNNSSSSSNSSRCMPQEKSNHWLQLVADYQPWDRLKEGTQIFILLLVLQNVDDVIVLPPSGSNSTQQLDTVIFMWG